MLLLANTIGMIGAGMFLLAFALLQYGVVTSHDVRYLWLNVIGGAAVVFSLFWFWNLPCFIVESAWVLISVHSLVRRRQGKV